MYFPYVLCCLHKDMQINYLVCVLFSTAISNVFEQKHRHTACMDCDHKTSQFFYMLLGFVRSKHVVLYTLGICTAFSDHFLRKIPSLSGVTYMYELIVIIIIDVQACYLATYPQPI